MFEMPATILLLEQGGPLVGVFSIRLSLLLVFVQEMLVGSNCYYGDIPPYCDSSKGHIYFFPLQSICYSLEDLSSHFNTSVSKGNIPSEKVVVFLRALVWIWMRRGNVVLR